MNKTIKLFTFLFFCLFSILIVSCNAIPKNNAPQTSQESEKKTIFLTFDDGPTDSSTPKVLNVLAEYNIQATFFVVGRQIPLRRAILKKIADDKHAIGIHTQTHIYKSIYSSAEALKEDILKCKNEINNVLPDYTLTLYRFPGGSFNLSESLKKVPESLGLKYFDWNAETNDSLNKYAPPEQLYASAIKTGYDRNNIILLMHDGVNYDNTVAALPEIIEYYKQKNYVFRTLDELIA